MADKIKKVSINTIEKAIEASYISEKTIEWNGISILVKPNLTLKDMLSFVDAVVKNCFSEDGTFMPETKNFAIRNYIVEYYTNISLPSNVEKRYDLLYHQDFLDAVIANIDSSQFDAIIDAIDEKVAHIAQSNIEAITKQMNDLCSSFDNITTRMEEVFSVADKDSLAGVIKAFGDGKIDEEKIAKAVLKYSNKPVMMSNVSN